jgi:ABC-type multidrug transport system fused ATPase/permease subunit
MVAGMLAVQFSNAAMSVSDPIILRYIVDQGLSEGSMRAIWLGVGAYLAILALRMGAEVVDQLISIRLRGAVASDIRGRCIDAVLAGSLPHLRRYEKGDLIARMTQDAQIVEDTVAKTVPLRLFSFMVIVAHGVVLLTFEWRLASLMLLLVPLQPLAFRLFSGRVTRASAAERSASSKLTATIGQIAAGSLSIRALRAGDEFRGRFDSRLAEAMAALRRVRLTGFLGAGLAEMLIGAVRFGAILALGALFVQSGGTTIGTVMAFFAFSGRLAAPIAAITSFLTSLRQGAVSLARLHEISSNLEPGDSGTQPELLVAHGEIAALEAKGITYGYPGAVAPALRDVSLTLPRGRKVTVVGENGSGKSTLALVLAGLLRPIGGRVTLISSEISSDSSTRGARMYTEVMYVPGEAFLLPGTIRDNLLVGSSRTDAVSDETLLDALRVVNADFALSSERGLDIQVAEDGANLSAGQRQKLNVARALARRPFPSYLILDEATSSFDGPSENALHAWLRDQDLGVCFITHSVKSVLWVDEVVVLAAGEVVEHGSPGELAGRADSLLTALLRSGPAADAGSDGGAQLGTRIG